MTLTDLPAFAVHTLTSGTEAEAVAHLQARGALVQARAPLLADVKPPRSGAQTPAGDRRNLRVCGHAGRHHGPGGAHGGHVLPPHAWPQSMHAAREWVTMLALWSRGHLSGYEANTFQGPLVPHCRFQRWRIINVRVFGVVHVKDSVETHRPILTRLHALTDAALSCWRVRYINPVRQTVTRYACWPDSLVTPGFLLCMESHLRFWSHRLWERRPGE